jgi:DNA-binding HxlR family transcriptional regulator
MADTGNEADDPLAVTFSAPAPAFDAENKEQLFRRLGQAHMVPLLHEFESNPGPRRFSDLQAKLGVPETTLTDRLRELTEAGFITRESYDEIPPRVEYTATQKTLDLRPAFEYLCRWAKHYGD